MKNKIVKTKIGCIIFMLLLFCISQVLAEPCGDVNSNGDIDIVDALLIAQYYVNLNPVNFDSTAADVNGDNGIDIVDSLLVAQYYVGLITLLPGCSQTPAPTNEPTQVSQITIEAEDAFYNDAVIESEYPGYSGIGYVNTTNVAGTYLEWTLNASVSGNAMLDFIFANGGTASRPMSVSVNGNIVVSSLEFPVTGWETWSIVSTQVTLYSGTNTLRITSLTAEGAPNLDKLVITFPGTITVPQPTTAPTPGPVAYDLVVAQDGSGNYTSVGSAVNAVPDYRTSWYTIYIKSGTYHEVIDIPSTKTYLRLVGENALTTILTYNNYASLVGSTSGSASVFVRPNNFIAENLTFENSFDYLNSSVTDKQAVALEPLGDRQIYINCRITGYQDTLYNRGTNYRQYFKNCYIAGRTDFIFGDATAIFNDCEIYHRTVIGSTMTAPNTSLSANYGLVFLNCQLTANSGTGVSSVNLGRPWAQSGSCHYLYCTMGAHIAAWSDMSENIWENARFGEYKSTGAGAIINLNRPQLTDAEAANYTVTNIMGGSDNWNPESVIANFN